MSLAANNTRSLRSSGKTGKKAGKGVLMTSLSDLLTGKNVASPVKDDERSPVLISEQHALEHELECLRAEVESLRNECRYYSGLPTVLSERAVTELKAGNYFEAMGLLSAVTVIDPGHIKAMLNLSVAFAELGFVSKAQEYLLKVLTIDPDNKTALRNMAILKGQETL